MKEEHDIETRLWNYIDGNVERDEKLQIEQLLNSNLKWVETYRQLLDLHQILKRDVELAEPSMQFTKDVMEEIAGVKIAPPTKSYINRRIIAAIAIFFSSLIAGLLIYGFAQVNWSAQSHNTSLPDFDMFNITKYVGRPGLNLFLMVDVVLGLILLDRYLSGKNRSSEPAPF